MKLSHKNKKRLTIGLLVLLLLLLVIWMIRSGINMQPKPTASPSPKPSQAATITIEGHVQSVAGKPVNNMLVFFNRLGTTTDNQGAFSLAIPYETHIEVEFRDANTNDRYEIAHTNEQQLFLPPSISKYKHDFVIEKVTP